MFIESKVSICRLTLSVAINELFLSVLIVLDLHSTSLPTILELTTFNSFVAINETLIFFF